MQYQQDLPFKVTLACSLWKNVSCKKDLPHSENQADFFAFFSAQPSYSEGLSAATEGDSVIDSATPISPCTKSPVTVLQVSAHFASMLVRFSF